MITELNYIIIICDIYYSLSSESSHFNFNEFSVTNCKIYPRTLQIALQWQLCRQQQMMCYLKFLLNHQNHQASANFFSWFIFHAETIFFGFGFDGIDFWFFSWTAIFALFSISQIIVAANSDEFDEKAKAPVVQQRGRFKVTSENVDLEKVILLIVVLIYLSCEGLYFPLSFRWPRVPYCKRVTVCRWGWVNYAKVHLGFSSVSVSLSPH